MQSSRDPLLVEVIAAIGAGRVWRGFIRHGATNEPLYGCRQPDGEIWINEPLLVVETLFHEAVHRMRPRWGEKRVTDTANELLKGLSDADIEALHGIYLTHVHARERRERRG